MCEKRKMQSVCAIRIIQILCMVILIRKIKCDVVKLEDPSKQIEYVTDCTAHCMQKNLNAILSGCYESCVNTDQSQELKRYEDESDEIRIICREDDSIVIKVENSTLNNDNESQINEKMYKGFTYLLQIQRNSSEHQLHWFYLSDSPIVKITHLQKNTSYIVTASIFSGNFEYRQLTFTKSFRTLEKEFFVPKSISNDTIELKYVLKNSTEMLSANLNWDKTDDKSCNYDIHMYEPREENDLIEPIFRKLSPIELDQLKMDSLKFDTEYIVEIYGVNGKHPNIEGKKSVFEFTTPNCSVFHGFDLQKCPPAPLLNINSMCEDNNLDSYRINVTWDLPTVNPDFYEVSINLFTNKAKVQSQNVSGSKNYAFFPEVNTTDAKYDVQIVAFSKGGYTESPVIEFSIKRQENIEELYLIFVCMLFSIAILLSIFLAYQNRRNRLRHKMEMYSKDKDIQELIRLINKHEEKMEVKPTDVELFEEIGKGAFGIVRRGILISNHLNPTNRLVAVKMLKEDAGKEDTEAFLKEITLMKSVGRHENIVGIVGHSIKSPDKMMLLTEFCSNGNLLEYLKKFSRKIQHSESNSQNIVCNLLYDDNPTNFCNISYQNESVKVTRVAEKPKVLFVENLAYGLLPTERDPELFNRNHHTVESASHITGSDLMKFAKQIATGMKFLANNKIVHRDLAARNVLVCADKTVKIADFGLSRDIDEGDVYMRKSAGRLPIKWLALESMTDQKYTSQSDVWSYGILLYEIVTFGATPYESESVTVDCLIDYLKSGKRIRRPDCCSFELYELMASCWRADPSKRPSFAEISVKIDQLNQNSHQNKSTVRQVEGLESSKRFRSDEPNTDEHAEDDAYLQPY